MIGYFVLNRIRAVAYFYKKVLWDSVLVLADIEMTEYGEQL